MAQNSESPKDTFIFGRHPVIEALESGKAFEKVWLQRGVRGDFEKQLRRLCKSRAVTLVVVPKDKLNRLTGGNHQGVVGQAALLPYYKLEDVLPGIFERGETPLLLILDGITDVRNMGAIARSAECLGAQAIILPVKGGAPVNAEAMKASAGALNHLAVCREKSLVTAVQYLRQSGIKVMATTQDEATPVQELDLHQPMAFILGAEGEGVQPSLLDAADDRCRIPQTGITDSLNVSVAAGILLYETLRQRLA